MMSEFRDPGLETLFRQASHELEGEDLTARVMSRTRNRLVTLVAGAAVASVLALFASWYLLGMPLLQFAVMISQFLTNPLVDVGDGWIGLALLPVNNPASITVLIAKGTLMGWKKLTGAALLR